MAEKYGTIPPKFTKKWWEYIWDYYKIHIISVIIVILVTVTTIYQVKTAPKYDFFINFVDSYFIDEEKVEPLKEEMSEYIDDFDGNGEKSICISQFPYSESNPDPQINAASLTKLYVEFDSNEHNLYIFSKDKYNVFYSYIENGFFKPVDLWLERDIELDDTFVFENKIYAVSLKNSEILKRHGIIAENLYIAIRQPVADQTEDPKLLETAKKIANILIK